MQEIRKILASFILFFNNLNFQIVKLDGIDKVIISKSRFIMTLKFFDIMFKPDWFAKIKNIADFIKCMKPLFPDMEFIACNTVLKDAVTDADIIVTGTSAQAPLLKADWIKKGAFYSHIGGWEDEYAVVQMADKIVCDDWETVKHRTQTVSRCYKDGVIGDSDIYGNLIDILSGEKKGRENNDEFIYFDAVGLAYVDVSIANEMYKKAKNAGFGSWSYLQEKMIFEKNLTGKVKF